jgi:hypothetical protein
MPLEGPVTPGITYQAQGIPNEVVEARKLRVSSAATLKDLEQDYFCYTPALFYMFVPLNGLEPFTDFVQDYGQQVWPFSIQFNKPVFRGLEVGKEPYWNHTLYFMEREHGIPFVQWMMQNAFYDRTNNTLARVRYRNIWIADALKMEKSAVLPGKPPIAQVMVFCLETNRGNYYIKPGFDPVLDLPTLKTQSTVFKDTAAFADAIYRGEADPYAAAEAAIGKDLGLADLEKRAAEAGPLRMPDPTAIEKLPKGQQEEIMKAIAQMKDIPSY